MMNQVTENLGLNIGGITDEPSLIPNMVTNLVKLDQAIGEGGKDDVARAAAAAAQEDADQASEDAADALALAQQAMASGLKLKKLSNEEASTALKLSTGSDSFAPLTTASNPAGYVINMTPRVKIIFIGQLFSEQTIGETANKTLTLRDISGLPVWRVWSLSIMPSEGKLDLLYKPTYPQLVRVITETASTPTSATRYYLNFVGVVQYNVDTDLGTDI